MLRRLLHLLLQLGDDLGQLGLGQVGGSDVAALRLGNGRRHLAAGHLALGSQLVGQDVDGLDDATRLNAVGLVVRLLDGAALVGGVNRPAHGVGHFVSVHDDLAVDVAGGAADSLGQRRLAAQEALLVGVEDGHQRHLRQVQPLAQQVDAHDHVIDAQPQITQNLRPLQRGDFGVQVVDLDAHLQQVVAQVFGHALGQRRHQYALAVGDATVDLADEIVHLASHRTYLDFGVDDARRPDDLLHDLGRVI